MIKKKFELEKIFLIFLVLGLLVQIFFLENINYQNRISEVKLCQDVNNSLLKKDIYKDDVIVQSLDVPLFPELQNFKCLNKIYKINQTPDNVIIYFAQNKIIFNYIYYFLVLISALIYSRYKSKKFLYISFILVLNFYVLLVATFIFIDILYFAFFLLIFPLLANIEYKNLFDSKYSFPIILLLGLILQLKYLSKEVIDWDISTFLIMGQDINRGYLPYENQFELKPILIFYIYSFIDLLSQNDLKVVKILNDIPLLISSYLMYKTLKNKTNSVYANICTLFFLVIMSISYYGVPGYSELYSLVPLAYFFYLLETKSNNNWYLLGFLLSLSTLISLGASPVFFGITIYLFKKHKEQILKFFIGFSFPHILVLFVYGINNLLMIYIEANLLIPSNRQNNSILEKLSLAIPGFYGSIFGLVNINIILFFATLATLMFILFYKILKNKKSVFGSLPYIFISCIAFLIFAGTTPHRFIFIIYFSVFYVHLIDYKKFLKIFVPLYLLVYLLMLNSYFIDIYSNIKNYELIESKYILFEAAQELKNYEYESILALDHHLVLYYLDIENHSYVNHPSNIFSDHINKFTYKDNDETTFLNLLENNPDIILCNSYVYNFCNKVEGYELIYINSDYGIEIYKRIFN